MPGLDASGHENTLTTSGAATTVQLGHEVAQYVHLYTSVRGEIAATKRAPEDEVRAAILTMRRVFNCRCVFFARRTEGHHLFLWA